MLVGMIILGQVGGSYNLSELVANPPTGWLPSVAIVLILIGALSKSAIVPLHFWLPGAMAAPTPSAAIYTLPRWSRPVSTSSRAWLPGTPIRRRGASPSSVWVCCR
ncbi:hypothetical protein GCM10020255_059880 [Rhodococcus baikonurensis]